MVDTSELLDAINKFLAKADDDLQNQLDDMGVINASDAVDEITAVEEKLAGALENETAEIISAVETSDDLKTFADDVWPDVKSTDTVDTAIEDIFAEEFAITVPKVADEYVKSVDAGLSVTTVSKRTTSWIQSWSKDLGEIMKLTSHKQVDTILQSGLNEGYSIAEFTQSLLDSGVRNEYYRARMVAVTEVLTAHSVAAQEAFMQSPAVEEKEWKHTGGWRNEPRPNHVAISGQRVPVNEPFTLIGASGGVYYPMYPRDPLLPAGERINCHCVLQPIVSEDVLGLSIEERRKIQEQAIADDDAAWEAELEAKNKALANFED